jgi:hypothetical protein
VIGLDQADSAITFAEDSGLLDEAISANLETEQLSALAKEDLAPVDLVTSTGCVGYVTEKSFERLLPVVTQGQSPWIANFVLRMFPFVSIEETLNDWGYVTEKLEPLVNAGSPRWMSRSKCSNDCATRVSTRPARRLMAMSSPSSICLARLRMRLKCRSSACFQLECAFPISALGQKSQSCRVQINIRPTPISRPYPTNSLLSHPSPPCDRLTGIDGRSDPLLLTDF